MSCVTPFRLEREMFGPVVAAIPDILGPVSAGWSMKVLREVAVGNVIPDLLVGTWYGQPSKFAFGNVARHILAFLQRDRECDIPKQRIEDELYLTPTAAEKGLSQLLRAGAVRTLDSGELRASTEFPAPSVKLIAIEMKMKRWREALAQGESYLVFADEAYVVLDGNQLTNSSELLREFELSPVGLLVQRGQQIEKLVDALPSLRSPSADRVLAVQKLTTSAPYCFA